MRFCRCCVLAVLAALMPATCMRTYANKTNTVKQVNIGENSTYSNSDNCLITVSDKDISDLILQNYSKLIRPRFNGKEALEVKVALRLFGIQDFIERESTIFLNAYIDLNWQDQFLQWEWSWPHRCLDSIALSSESVWLADIVLLNSPVDPNFVANSHGLKVTVQKDGTVGYSSLGRLQTICELDLEYFPFDRQICPVHFETWTYPSTKERLTLTNDSDVSIVEQLWTENKQWRLVALKAYKSQTVYPDSESYDKIVYYIILERKSLFFYVNVIIPSLVIAIVELVTFFLPLTEVVKVHISFTCLLAYSVFQSMVIADLPRTSTSVPLLCLYIDLQMSYIGLALVGEAVVFYYAENSVKKKHIPEHMVAFFRNLGHVFCVHEHARTNSIEKPPKQPAKTIKLNDESGFAYSAPFYDVETVLEQVITEHHPIQTAKDRQEFWLFVAEIAERINFVTYVVLISITPAAMFAVMPHQQSDIFDRLDKNFLKK